MGEVYRAEDTKLGREVAIKVLPEAFTEVARAGTWREVSMSWFRFSSLIFGFWAVVFFFFPRFSNEFAGVGYIPSGQAEDWTQLIGLFSLGFAVLLNDAHRSISRDVRRCVARGVIAFALPCALVMTYWQVIPDRRWFRLDILNIALLYVMAYGMFTMLRTRSAPARESVV